jgi:fluoroquinolone transport system permease protein
MKKIISLAITDFKLIFRDPSLKAFLFLPLLLFAVFIWLIPNMVEKYDILNPYLSIFLMVGVIENTQTFSFISTMVLIDEKETDVAKVYGVVPLNSLEFISSRLLIPYIITVMFNVVLLRVQTFYPIDWTSNILISMLSGLILPIYILGINSIVKNRMEGMIYVKAFNMLVLIPIAAYFVPSSFKYIFSILPTFWLYESIETFTHNSSMLIPMVIGYAFFAIATIWISKVFLRKHFV